MISGAFRAFKHRRRQARAKAELAARPDAPGRPHGLPGLLVVSLTSYPARFGTLALTLQGVLRQSVQPDRVILWIAKGDEAELPPDCLGLAGLEIRSCPDWRSYKKIVPTLLAHPDAFVVTADDDVYYPVDWLEKLVGAAKAGARVACHRAHRIALQPDGRPAPYSEWRHNVDAPERSPLVFLTGVSGVIYAPGVFHPDVTRDDLFTRLAPRSDDVWLYWMHRLNGAEAQKIGNRARILEWEGSQAQSLRAANLHGTGNDQAIAAMIGHYGWPG
ncbi:glycosyltransferase family 2 protein [Paracoccus benzoatiresistens]|uniref:Glycosyltransferase family 2 protein n=1 Tax=Paracoccus benzoatiresistens TaxID=2997341 RepID=A0ABT4J0A7_9RHOB|nr:glycosyltransferase family 2 protein [Paracoccus sp. EF6]MCZ0960544.1 glycosyltransferase family 2 protein [Paracoccus sp. EF6]